MSVEDQQLVNRLSKLKSEIREMKGDIPSQSEIEERLAKLKGIDPEVYRKPAAIYVKPKTNNVDDAPYSTIPRTVLYCDMNFKDNSHHPFNGVSGMNNLKLSYISIEKYTDKKLTSVLENIYDYFNIKSNNVKIFLKSGLFLDYTYNSNTNYMIYDGETFLMQNVLSNSFESTYDSESGNATFKYKQPLTPFVSINSLKNYNKKNLYFLKKG